MHHPQLAVRRRSGSDTRAWLQYGPFRWPCALGRSGIRALKREGDGATPRGRHALAFVYYRADRERHLACRLDLLRLAPNFGWCDAANDANYNRPIRHPYPRSAERLWREDALYDLIVVLAYNIRPRVRGCGSAIFLHVARDDLRPTEGCIALEARHLRRLLVALRGRRPSIVI